MIQARLITQQCSDLKVVNAARVSMAVEHSEFDEKADTGLIRYLSSHRHWTPFSHNRDTIFFRMDSRSIYNAFIQLLTIKLSAEEKASMVIQDNINNDGINYIAVKTSFFGWVNIIKNINQTFLGKDGYTLPLIISILYNKYPVSTKAYLDEELITLYNKPSLYKINTDILRNMIPFLDSKMFDITFYETVPIFVARQRFKHMVMNTYNEISKRYVDSIPEVYIPLIWRLRPDKSIKQGSGADHPNSHELDVEYQEYMKKALDYYDKLINVDRVAPEQARIMLPQSMMTEYYVTGNIDAWERFLNQRLDGHAQKEIRDLADIIRVEYENLQYNINVAKTMADPLEHLNALGVF